MKWVKSIFIALAVIFVLIQFVRPDRTNPPLDPARKLQAPPQVAAILDRSCRDCHSNETDWPWYTNIAPISWWLADHVKEGRHELNLSEWNGYTARRKGRKLKEICEQIKDGEMPLPSYVRLHAKAKLSDADRETLCTWAQQFGQDRGRSSGL
jgi:hypothetical protein